MHEGKPYIHFIKKILEVMEALKMKEMCWTAQKLVGRWKNPGLLAKLLKAQVLKRLQLSLTIEKSEWQISDFKLNLYSITFSKAISNSITRSKLITNAT